MIGLVHHHLRRGGVTRVLMEQARLLRDAGEEVCVFSGEVPADPLPEGIIFKHIPQLGYADTATDGDVEFLLSRFLAEAEDTLWHFHNHSLGKNPAYTRAVLGLAATGRRMILQIHDFAEDGRPANMRRLREQLPDQGRGLYPLGPHIRYATLQVRDAAILRGAGVPADSLHLLPNPVTAPGPVPPPSASLRRVLYLGRCIRRKNMGEFLLWAQVHREDFSFATSLIPENPVELEGFERWRALAERKNPGIRFGIGMGAGRGFEQVVAEGDFCISTSVGEGFGMSFLEPYLFARPLGGRDLPDITEDFKKSGIRLDGLYAALPVPVDRLDAEFWPRARTRVCESRAAMGLEAGLSVKSLQSAWSCGEGQIDFGRLDEEAQSALLLDGFRPDSGLEFSTDAITHNRRILERQFGSKAYLARLQKLYAGLVTSKSVEYANASAVREAFAHPRELWLLRT